MRPRTLVRLRGGLEMPEILADLADPTCYRLYFQTGIEENQSLAPDIFPSGAPERVGAPTRDGTHARDPKGRFAKGHSGNSKGRPRGIRNPKRRVLTLQAYRRNPQAASALLDRKPRLLRPLLARVLPLAS